MRRMRARWVVGTPLVLGTLALSCGSGGVDGLFSQPSSNDAAGAVSAGASNHAGATHESSGAGGLDNTSGGAESNSGAGASQGGASSHAGEVGQAGANGGSTSGGGAPAGAGGSPAGAGGSHAGAAGSHAGAGGSHAGAGGSPAGAGGSHAGAGGSHAGAGGSHAGAGGSSAGAGGSNTGGTSAGGASGSGAGGTLAGGAAGAGGGAGAACTDNGACLNAEYCAKPSCAAKAEGHCTPSPADCGNTKLAVVCGCDGLTYHDACLLHQARQNSSALDAGACSPNADSTVTCTDGDAQTCTGLGGVCGFKADDACIAVGPGNSGICWVLPASCPGSDEKTAQLCSAESTSCTSECDAIKNGERYALLDHCN